MRRVLAWGPLALALGCTFDASGIAESSAAGPGGPGTGGSTGGPGSSGESSGSGEVVTTGGAGTEGVGSSGGPVTTGEPVTTGAPVTTDPSTTTTGQPDPGTSETGGPSETTGDPPDSTTTGAPMCPQPYKQIVLVADATVVAPMGKFMSNVGEGTVAYSDQAEKGQVNFVVTPPCDGPVAVWARVLDGWSGVHGSDDPDSFYPHADNGPETAWLYGCQTDGMPEGYHWLRVRGGKPGDPCNTYPDWSPPLTAGPHTITLRNREDESDNNNVASIARLLVTSDMGYVPQPGD